MPSSRSERPDRPEPRPDAHGPDPVDARELREEIRRWIPDALAGDLDPEMQELVERHVARDLELAREWEAQRRARAALASLAAGADGDPGFDDVFFADLHRGIVHAIREQGQLAKDLETLSRRTLARRSFSSRREQSGAIRLVAACRGFALRVRRALRPRVPAGPAARVALAATCLLLGVLLGRFADREGLLVPVPGAGPNFLEEGGIAVPVTNVDRTLQEDLRKVYDEIKSLPAPRGLSEGLPGLPALGPLEPAPPAGPIASTEAGVDF